MEKHRVQTKISKNEVELERVKNNLPHGRKEEKNNSSENEFEVAENKIEVDSLDSVSEENLFSYSSENGEHYQ